jgi:hypothetical protein
MKRFVTDEFYPSVLCICFLEIDTIDHSST